MKCKKNSCRKYSKWYFFFFEKYCARYVVCLFVRTNRYTVTAWLHINISNLILSQCFAEGRWPDRTGCRLRLDFCSSTYVYFYKYQFYFWLRVILFNGRCSHFCCHSSFFFHYFLFSFFQKCDEKLWNERNLLLSI